MNEIEKAESMLVEERKQKMLRLRAEDKAIMNSRMTNVMVKVASLPKINLNNANEIYDRAMQYFNICIEEGIKPTQEGIASALKITRWTFSAWVTGKTDKPKEIREVLSWIHSTLEALTMQMMVEGQIQPIPALFVLKNNYGYTNDEVDMEVKESKEKVDIASIKAKYELLED